MKKKFERRLLDKDADFARFAEPILQDERYHALRDILHHGHVSTYDHCLSVCLEAMEFAFKNHVKVDPSSLIRASLLHDYFLYDWHVKPHPKHHATKHGVYAAINALKDFGLNTVERNAIESHMWPVCLFTLPLFRESWIVQLADKRVTWKEFLARFAKKKAA